MSHCHIDCWNYQPIDVVKGICVKSEQMIHWNGEVCPGFELKPKCEQCSHFSDPNDENIGTCSGLSDGAYWVLGSRNATTCEAFAK